MNVGRLLMTVGGLLFIVGLAVTLIGKRLPFGRLPGDITLQRGHFVFIFPLATSLLLSLVLTLILWLLRGIGSR